ncbi:tRNA pseudouridine(13) synthase TruD [Methylomonas methanica]|uniref:tRNA pseudouridine synthase D n=1 Tax=Methylomonas methanica (strain DSM 25384 / MC09) TaxID=857087 RepID=G0A6Z1_METMM|nr:tRNA pseudouridine(13) synthase TruD [Methylomonas methanica]AEG01785.1 tRNA pseudouridine synthase D [Methylomonas methanica MC09]
MTDFSLPEWPYAFGGPSGTGNIKTEPDDFIVEESLSFQPEGNGEHVFLHIEKIGENTEYVARLLARHAGVRQRDIGYAGLKDRHGRTRQWFSVWLPGKADPDWSPLETGNLKILQSIRHPRKLKRGVLAGNRFSLRIRNWQGDRDRAEQQLRQIQTQGFPNYFGEQRFGHQGRNIDKALAMFGGVRVKPEQRSIYLSAARSYLFNLILAERVQQQTWLRVLPGDVCKLQGSNSQFVAETPEQTLQQRMAGGDIHATAALWGKGLNPAGGEVADLENAVIAGQPALATGLLKAGLELDRRALRVIPENLNWQWTNECLHLDFGLPAGSYATALLRELIQVSVGL